MLNGILIPQACPIFCLLSFSYKLRLNADLTIKQSEEKRSKAEWELTLEKFLTQVTRVKQDIEKLEW